MKIVHLTELADELTLAEVAIRHVRARIQSLMIMPGIPCETVEVFGAMMNEMDAAKARLADSRFWFDKAYVVLSPDPFVPIVPIGSKGKQENDIP